jgi:hypothetical protein
VCFSFDMLKNTAISRLFSRKTHAYSNIPQINKLKKRVPSRYPKKTFFEFVLLLNEQQHASPTTNHNSTIVEVTRPRFEMPLSVEEMMRLSKEKKKNTKKSKETEESKWIKFLMKLK